MPRLDDTLHRLSFSNDPDRLALVEQALRNGADPNALDGHGWSPLAAAALFQEPIITALLDAGGDPNFFTRDSSGRALTPLTMAFNNRKARNLNLLIDRGARLDVYCQQGGDITGAMIAAMADRPELLARRLDAGDDPNARSSGGRLALAIAARNESDACVKLLLERGADPLLAEEKGHHAIYVAAAHQRADSLRALLHSAVGKDIFAGQDNCPFINAVGRDDVSTASILLDAGAPINAIVKGRTAAMDAIESHSAQALRLLLARGLDPEAGQPNGLSLAELAVAEHNQEALEALLDAGAAVDFATQAASLRELSQSRRPREYDNPLFPLWLERQIETQAQARAIHRATQSRARAPKAPKGRL